MLQGLEQFLLQRDDKMARVNLYSKEEIDNKFSEVESDVYTKAEVDALINNIVNTTYTKQQVNSIVNNVSSNVYNKSEIDERLEGVGRTAIHKFLSFADMRDYIINNPPKTGDFLAIRFTQNFKGIDVAIMVSDYTATELFYTVTGNGVAYYGDATHTTFDKGNFVCTGIAFDPDNVNNVLIIGSEYDENVGWVTINEEYTPTNIYGYLITTEEV